MGLLDYHMGSVLPLHPIYALGTTEVTVTAADASGNSAQCIFQVTVSALPPLTISCPEALTTEATGPGGAVVDFRRRRPRAVWARRR